MSYCLEHEKWEYVVPSCSLCTGPSPPRQVLDARSSWATLISALKILVDSQEDRLFVVYNGGVALLCEAVLALHVMLHEATACHVTGELTDLVRLLADILRCCKTFRDNKVGGTAIVGRGEAVETAGLEATGWWHRRLLGSEVRVASAFRTG